MTPTNIIEVTVTFHNGQKDKIKIRGDLHNYARARAERAVREGGSLEFDPTDRVNSNVTYFAVAGSFRSVEIAKL